MLQLLRPGRAGEQSQESMDVREAKNQNRSVLVWVLNPAVSKASVPLNFS